jgi:hypothetical protein
VGPRRLFILYGLNLLVMMTKLLGFGELVNFLVGYLCEVKGPEVREIVSSYICL